MWQWWTFIFCKLFSPINPTLFPFTSSRQMTLLLYWIIILLYRICLLPIQVMPLFDSHISPLLFMWPEPSLLYVHYCTNVILINELMSWGGTFLQLVVVFGHISQLFLWMPGWHCYYNWMYVIIKQLLDIHTSINVKNISVSQMF